MGAPVLVITTVVIKTFLITKLLIMLKPDDVTHNVKLWITSPCSKWAICTLMMLLMSSKHLASLESTVDYFSRWLDVELISARARRLVPTASGPVSLAVPAAPGQRGFLSLKRPEFRLSVLLLASAARVPGCINRTSGPCQRVFRSQRQPTSSQVASGWSEAWQICSVSSLLSLK